MTVVRLLLLMALAAGAAVLRGGDAAAGCAGQPCEANPRVFLSSSAGGTASASRDGDDEVRNGEAVPFGATVTFTADPDSGWMFSRWDGDCAGQIWRCALTATINASAGAVFTCRSSLIGAAGTDDLPALECNLARGADVNAKDHDGFTALHRAAFNGREQAAERLLQAEGVSVNAPADNGSAITPLGRALEGGRFFNLARRLIRAGGHHGVACESPLVVNPDSASPPCRACAANQIPENGLCRCAEGFAENDDGDCRPGRIVYLSHSAGGIIEAFGGGLWDLRDGDAVPPGTVLTVRAFADPNYQWSSWGGACADDSDSQCVATVDSDLAVRANFSCAATLHEAAARGDPAWLECHLAAGADPGEWLNGSTPLIKAVAADRRRLEIVNRLLAAGADVNRGDDSEAPLHHAAFSGDLAMVERLLAAPGVSVNLVNASGETPLRSLYDGGHGSADGDAAYEAAVRLIRAGGHYGDGGCQSPTVINPDKRDFARAGRRCVACGPNASPVRGVCECDAGFAGRRGICAAARTVSFSSLGSGGNLLAGWDGNPNLQNGETVPLGATVTFSASLRPGHAVSEWDGDCWFASGPECAAVASRNLAVRADLACADFHRAAQAGDLAGVNCNLAESASEVDARDRLGATPLHYAAENGRLEIINRLLAAGAEVNPADDDDATPLRRAAGRYPDAASRLLAAGAHHGRACRPPDRVNPDSHAPPCLDWTTLTLTPSPGGALFAGWNGSPNLQSGEAVPAGTVVTVTASPEDGYLQVRWSGACAFASAARCELTMTLDAETGAVFACENFHAAAENGDLAAVNCNLANGAEVDERDGDGNTPLGWAAYNGRPAAVDLLLQRGAAVTVKNDFLYTPLHDGVESDNPEVVERLLRAGAGVNERGGDGRTPLHLYPDPQIISLLLQAGAEVNARDDRGETPLHNAAERRKLESLEILLRAGASINATNNEGETPLAVAEKSQVRRDMRAAALRLLIANGAHYGTPCASPQRVNPDSARPPCVRFPGVGWLSSAGGTVSAGRAGSADLQSGEMVPPGATVTFTATPNPGRQFANWAGDCDRARGPQCVLPVNADALVWALFVCVDLHGAAQGGDLAGVECALSSGAVIDRPNADGDSPLQLAIAGGHAEIVRRLVMAGANHGASCKLPEVVNPSGVQPACVRCGADAAPADGVCECDSGFARFAGGCAALRTVSVSFSAGGTVRARSGNAPVDETIPSGAKVTFTATPDDGHEFSAWGGDCAATAEWAACVVTVAADVHARGNFTCVNFHRAAERGNLAGVNCNLEGGADVERRNDRNETPLHRAAHGAHVTIVNLLLERGADANVKDGSLYTPLHEAIGGGYSGGAEVVRRLLRAGAGVHEKTNGGNTPLLLVDGTVSEDLTLVTLLLDAGADANAQNNNGKTPLHKIAAQEMDDSIAIAGVLLGAGASLNATDNSGETPLGSARREGRAEMIRFLTAAGGHYGTPCAPPDIVNPHAAAPPCLTWLAVSLSLSAGGTVAVGWRQNENLQNDEPVPPGATVTFTALPDDGHEFFGWGGDCGFEPGPQCVLRVTTDATVRADFICAYFHRAIHRGDRAAIECNLADPETDVNTADPLGDTPLHAAVFRGRLEIADRLLTLGANADAENFRGRTPLHAAAARGWMEIADRLLAAGARVNPADDDGATPLGEALANGHSQIVRFLIAAGAHYGEECVGASRAVNPESSAPPCRECERGAIRINGYCEGRTVSLSFSSGGTVAAAWAGDSDLQNGGMVPPGATVTFTAIPNSGHELSAWSGDCESTPAAELTCAAQATMNLAAGAVFADINECARRTDDCASSSAGGACENTAGSFVCGCAPGWAGDGQTCERRFHVFLSPSRDGTVSVAWAESADLQNGETVWSGATVTFTATPDSNRAFLAWRGDCAAAAGPECVLTVTMNASAGAVFSCDDSLAEAAESGDLAALECNLANGADVNAKDPRGFTALHLAAFHGHMEIVERLLRAETIRVNADADGPVGTPLAYAREGGRDAVALRLIRAGGHYGAACENPLAVNPDSADPPCAACAANQIPTDGLCQCAEGFAESGGDCRAGWIVYLSHSSGGKIFAARDGDAEVQDGETVPPGATVTFTAVANANRQWSSWGGACAGVSVSQCVATIVADLAARANFSCAGNLLEAAGGGDLARLECHLAAGADVNETTSVDGFFWSPLHLAVYNGRLAAADRLLSAGADVNLAIGLSAATPLHYAVFFGRLELLDRLLAEPGVSVNAADNASAPPLFYAYLPNNPLPADLAYETAVRMIRAGAHYGGNGCELPMVVNPRDPDPGGANLRCVSCGANQGPAQGVCECDSGFIRDGENCIAGWRILFSPPHGGILTAGWHGNPNLQSGEAVPAGVVATLSASPFSGYEFSRWSGDCAYARDSECLLVGPANRTATVGAAFACATDFHQAARTGDLPGVNCHLEQPGADANQRDDSGAAPLHHAAENGRLEIVNRLLPAGADVNAADGNGATPLRRAAGRYRNVADRLITAGAHHGRPCEAAQVNPESHLPPCLRRTTLSLSTSAGGTVSAGWNQDANLHSGESVPAGATVTVTATPDSGYEISIWTGACESTSGLRCALTLTMNAEAGAVFACANFYECLRAPRITLQDSADGTLSAEWSGRGGRGGSPNLQNGESVPFGTEVTFAARPNPGLEINSWTGACEGASGPRCVRAVTMDLFVGADFVCVDLHDAARSGDLAGIECRLSSGADVNRPDADGNTPAQLAAAGGHAAAVLRLIRAGANHDGVFTCENFHGAAEAGDLAEVNCNLASGADANQRNEFGDAPLHRAALFGRPAVVNRLLDAGASASAQNETLHTPLHYAAEANFTVENDAEQTDRASLADYAATAERLLRAGADANARSDVGDAPLHLAVFGGAAMVSVVLAGGANINARKNDGDAPLHRAAYHGSLESVETLLRAGAAVNQTGANERTPLGVARWWGRARIVRRLIAAGAHYGAPCQGRAAANPESDNPPCLTWPTISISISAGGTVAVDPGQNMNLQSGESVPPESILTLTATPEDGYEFSNWGGDCGFASGPECVLRVAADATVRADFACADFHRATHRGDLAGVECNLANPETDASAADPFGDTPLHIAAFRGRIEIADHLLAAGANADAENLRGRAPLHVAAARGRMEIVDRLLAAGARVNIIDADGITPLRDAYDNGRLEIFRRLLAAGGHYGQACDGANQFANPESPAPPCRQCEPGEILLDRVCLAGRTVAFSFSSGGTLSAGWARNANLQGGETIPLGATVTFTATPNSGATLSAWGGDCNSATGPKCVLTVAADTYARANFACADFHLAAQNDDLAGVECNLAAGADVNARDFFFQTPLLYAAEHGSAELVRRLLLAGARVNQANIFGGTPLAVARSRGRGEVARLLVRFGAHYGTPCESPLAVNPESASPPCAGGAALSLSFSAGGTVSIGWKNLELQNGDTVPAGATVTFTAIPNSGYEVSPWGGDCDSAAGPKCILAATANVFARADFACADFHQAAFDGDLAGVECNLASGADANARDIGLATPLHPAAYRARLEVIDRLLSAGARVDLADASGRLPLHSGVASGSPAVVGRLLLAGADPDAQSGNSNRPLHWAVGIESPEVVGRLLQGGANIEAQNGNGETPLLYAALEDSDPAVADRLLRAGANPDAKDIDDWTPLHAAAWNGNLEIMRRLLRTDARLNEINSDDLTPLGEAGAAGNENAFRALLAAGAHYGTPCESPATVNPTSDFPPCVAGVLVSFSFSAGGTVAAGWRLNANLQNGKAVPFGATVTLAAVADAGHAVSVWSGDCVFATGPKCVLTAAANVFARAEFACMNFHRAAQDGDLAGVECNLSAGANVNAQDADGITPLGAARAGGHGEIVRLLASAGGHYGAPCESPTVVNLESAVPPCANGAAVSLSFSAGGTVAAGWNQNPNLQGGEAVPLGATVTFAAAADAGHEFSTWGGDCDSATGTKCVLVATANVFARADFVCANFHLAALNGRLAGVDCNLASGANVNAPDGDLQTPLHFAAGAGRVAVAGRLLAAGADPDARDARGFTPLHRAARGHPQVVARLLRENARVNPADADGNTPLAVARGGGHEDIVRMLAAAGAHYGTPCENSFVVNLQSADPPCLAGALVSLSFSAGGTVAAGWNQNPNLQSGDAVPLGATVTFTAIPNPGYEISLWGGDCEPTPAAEFSCVARATVNLSARADFACADFHRAAAGGDLAGVKCNLAAGADINAQDADGITPLGAARAGGHENIARHLASMGAHYGTPCEIPAAVNPASADPPCVAGALVSLSFSADGTVAAGWDQNPNLQSGDAIPLGATVTFAATPNPGYEISLWTGDCEPTPAAEFSCVARATVNLRAGAIFADADECARRTDDCAPAESGGACKNTAGGFTCACAPDFAGNGRTCAPFPTISLSFSAGGTVRAGWAENPNLGHGGKIPPGATVTFTAVPDADHALAAWLDDCAGETGPKCVRIAAKNLRAGASFRLDCPPTHGEINGACVHRAERLPENEQTCQNLLRGDWADEGVCSGIDINDTFCLANSPRAFPCLGLFNHVRACNLLGRPALDPWHCAAACPSRRAAGARCLK